MLLTTSKDTVAREMVHGLPFKLVQLVQGDEFKGGKLINLKSDLAKPCAHDLALNYVWLLPIVKASPQKAMFGKQILWLQSKSCFKTPLVPTNRSRYLPW